MLDRGEAAVKGTNAERMMKYRNYFLAHPELLKLTQPEVVRALKKAGIIAPTTYWRDCKFVETLRLELQEKSK